MGRFFVLFHLFCYNKNTSEKLVFMDFKQKILLFLTFFGLFLLVYKPH